MSDDFQEVVFGGGLTVRVSREVAVEAEPVLARLLADGVPAKLAAKDPTLWGPAAAAEAAVRLGWVDTFERSRALLPQLAELREELGDLDHVVLAGMGGSSLAPEVISLTLGKRLTVLDTTDPGQVAAALRDRLDRTVVVVSSKSGGTVETDSQRRAYLQAFLDAGLSPAEAGRHFVVVTDPGSPLEATAREMGAFVLLADADVGGRYSALTAFGLVPTALAGVDVAELLDQAEEFATTLTGDVDNPAFLLGAVLGAAARHGRDKLALVDDGSGITGLGDWAEQLIAESTGKEGKGILPVVVETPISAGATGPDVLTATIGGALGVGAVPGSGVVPHVSVNGALGAQFLCWEAATAVAGRVLGIDPFDQPNVTESKQNTTKILDEGLPAATPSFTEGAIVGYGDANSLEDALRALLGAAGQHGYVAVLAYLDRFADADVAKLREQLAAASGRPVTFGWGPRFLHSTGQYHKGGPQHGAFLQITGEVAEDLTVPGKPYTFGQLQAAQAAGDRQALAGRGRPLLHLHLTDRAKGIAQLLEAATRLQPYKER
ncbi:glucose-6-phosphate isomerase [Catellatospora citrea]|uniref:Glucose-6-phosphate isomerase n=1 Tax=Catellatospora citrea TaxID=53366 RepID=A0A8J3KE29_9ACTN|nr:glucose-6-phosphate isomerase [Catellatospora citrea]RKE06953.1 glucose-6-phosphate isomerase [Catellatospora citrea]GIF95103.1 glucose-6-phosphate isomerase [Catellatospora citrea]